MSETKFTKGKWFTKEGSEFGEIKSVMVFYPHGFLTSANVIKVDESRKDGESWIDMRRRTEVDRNKAAIESNANMYLIAAAPNLYHRLEESTDAMEALVSTLSKSGFDPSDMKRQIEDNRLFLAMARGEKC